MCNSGAKIVRQMARAGSPIHRRLANKIDPPYLPCADDYTTTYLNVCVCILLTVLIN